MIINEFEWDDNKNESNKKKHNIDFGDAKEVFKDEDKKKIPDLRKDYGEKRWKLIGELLKAIIVVIYTIRGAVIRIISARPAKKYERELYNNQKQSKNENKKDLETEKENKNEK